MSDKSKDITVALPSSLNLRDIDGTLKPSEARLIVNMIGGRLVPGLRRYGFNDPARSYLNQDLHDQLLGAVRDQYPRPTPS